MRRAGGDKIVWLSPVISRTDRWGTDLARYLARELFRKIRNGQLSDFIEGGFLPNWQLLRMEFDDGGETITSSSTDSQFDTSLFRLHPNRPASGDRV